MSHVDVGVKSGRRTGRADVRAHVIEVGSFVMSGPTEELAKSDEVREVYLGG